MDSCEIVTLVTAISCAVARCVPKEDLPILSAILGQVASTLATITVNEEVRQAKESPTIEAPGSQIIEVRPIVPMQ